MLHSRASWIPIFTNGHSEINDASEYLRLRKRYGIFSLMTETDQDSHERTHHGYMFLLAVNRHYSSGSEQSPDVTGGQIQTCLKYNRGTTQPLEQPSAQKKKTQRMIGILKKKPLSILVYFQRYT